MQEQAHHFTSGAKGRMNYMRSMATALASQHRCLKNNEIQCIFSVFPCIAVLTSIEHEAVAPPHHTPQGEGGNESHLPHHDTPHITGGEGGMNSTSRITTPHTTGGAGGINSTPRAPHHTLQRHAHGVSGVLGGGGLLGLGLRLCGAWSYV